MAGFFETLTQRPDTLSKLAKYTIANGLLYLAIGFSALLAPPALLDVLMFAELGGYEAGLIKALGVTVAVIGWFYVMGGRTGATSFGLSTVVDRLLLPFLLVPLVLTGMVEPMMVIPFAILDPVLGIGAYLIWRSERAG